MKKYHPKKIILFGSFARGDYHAFSDVDLIIIKETKLRFTDRIGEVLELCSSELPIEPLVYTPAEFNKLIGEGNDFITTAIEGGVVLYEQ